jgi:SAM-dependent methyltransferase
MSFGDDRTRQQIAGHWDRRTEQPRPSRTNWWQSRTVRRHINRRVCGEPFEGTGEGWVHVLRRRLDGRVLRRGISVGCGFGNKEMRFLRLGLVERFDLYELSESRIAKGSALAAELGLAERVCFHRADALETVTRPDYDLVHWNNSLHHMLDVAKAVQWSRHVLLPDGVFFMDDFVGPSRFQWSDRALAVATGVRSVLPRRLLRNPHAPPTGEEHVDPHVARPNARRIAREDPSEAADSARILPVVRDIFPAAEVQLTGGIVYHLALANILHNFDEDDAGDLALLELLLELDTVCLANPDLESPYAVALSL